MPLAKKAGGVRPIAVGDVLRRLVGKVLLSTSQARAEVDSLRPMQVGVGVPNAAESVAMGVQAVAAALGTGESWVCLQVDFENAFNSLDRSALLSSAAVRAPTAFNYLRFAYGGDVPLFVGETRILSRTGTHQGCPLGPLGFALGIQPLAEQLQRHGGLAWASWYLDDGVLIGDPLSIAHALEFLEVEALKLGLRLNRGKSVLWGPAASAVENAHGLQVRDWNAGEGITVLGCPVDPVGHTGQLRAAWEDAGARLSSLLELLSRLPDAQVAHHLLRASADGCRVNHLLRASDSYRVQALVQQCDDEVLDAFGDLCGVALTPAQRIQTTLPLRSGGCGIKGVAQLQPAARIAALAGFYGPGAQRVGVPEYARLPDPALLSPVLADLTSRLGHNADPLGAWASDPSRVISASSDHYQQRWWGTLLGTHSFQGLVDAATARDQARLLEIRSGLGGTWMSALPSAASGAVFSSEEYCLGLRWWLGAPLLRPAAVGPAPACPGCELPVDPEGDHFLCCRRNNFADRHNAVQDAIFSLLSANGISVAREVPLAASADAHLRPADLLLPNWHGGLPMALDVTVVHGWSTSAAPSHVLRDNWRPHLRRREVLKHDKYDTACQREGWHFAAAAFGTWGGLGPEAAKILSRVVKRATAAEDATTQGSSQRRAYETIGVALFRQVWRLLGAKNAIR